MCFRFSAGKIFTAIFIALLFIFQSCSKSSGNSGKLPDRINSIVSLSPSVTRQIVDLGAETKIKGVVSHDDLAGRCEVVGTLVNPNMEKIVRINPDAIFLSEEDSITQKTDRLLASSIAWHIFPRNRNFETIIRNYRDLSVFLKSEKNATEKISSYMAELDSLKRGVKPGKRVAVFLSGKPFISVSGNSYIGAIIRDSGSVNVFEKIEQPYPIVSHESLLAADPEIIICMFPDPDIFFKKIGAALSRVKAVSSGNIVYIKPDNIAFYTPRDYIDSVKQIREISSRGD